MLDFLVLNYRINDFTISSITVYLMNNKQRARRRIGRGSGEEMLIYLPISNGGSRGISNICLRVGMNEKKLWKQYSFR